MPGVAFFVCLCIMKYPVASYVVSMESLSSLIDIDASIEVLLFPALGHNVSKLTLCSSLDKIKGTDLII